MRDKYDILVLGGGISGITASLEAAETGYNILLVEKKAYLGGKVAGMNQYFPKLCPPYCGLEINFRRIRENPNIDLQTSAIIKSIEGNEGDFTITLESTPTYVNENCTSCGECTAVCPVERIDSYNQGLGKTKAIYIPHDLAFPSRYTIDTDVCTTTECKKCLEVCKYEAINFAERINEVKVYARAIILATGWNLYDVSKVTALKFGVYPNVISSLMLERMVAPNGIYQGNLTKPSDGKQPRSIAFLQCAGSRDENHLNYCSGVCCSASLKQAINLADKLPDVTVRIFYIDMRVMGRNEDFLQRVEEHPRIELIKGKVAKVKQSEDQQSLILEVENIVSGKKEINQADLVVLASGIVPDQSLVAGKALDDSGFILPDELPKGIYATGCCKKPIDVSMSVKDATGTALRAIQSVVKMKLSKDI